MTLALNVQRKRRARRQETCHCAAYPFPHRAGSGPCVGDEPGPFCGCCGQPCGVHAEDYGVGEYEFWGQRGVHRDVQAVSGCCEAEVFEDAALTRPYKDSPDWD